MIDFNATPEEFDAINLIVERALTLPWPRRPDRLSLVMDITAAHREVRLNLTALLKADDANFAHDVGGIVRHIDRQTGKLENCFVPRYAATTVL